METDFIDTIQMILIRFIVFSLTIKNVFSLTSRQFDSLSDLNCLSSSYTRLLHLFIGGDKCRKAAATTVARGQFQKHAYAQIIHKQFPKQENDNKVISRKKVVRLVELLYFGRFVLYAVRSSLMKLTPAPLKIKKPKLASFLKC